MKCSIAAVLIAALVALAVPARAAEFYIGEPVVKNNMQVVPNYLVGIEMDNMKGMAMPGGKDAIHLEVDVHAAKGEQHGFAEDSWIPYLTVTYRLQKEGGGAAKTGRLEPMTAGDGPHYASNLKMDGPGKYRLTYHFEPPSANGFRRHVDKATGVPDWWKPFDAEWTFDYPSKQK